MNKEEYFKEYYLLHKEKIKQHSRDYKTKPEAKIKKELVKLKKSKTKNIRLGFIFLNIPLKRTKLMELQKKEKNKKSRMEYYLKNRIEILKKQNEKYNAPGSKSKAYTIDYQKTNKDRIRKVTNQYNKLHKKEIGIFNKKYYDLNRVELLRKQKEKRLINKDFINAKAREKRRLIKINKKIKNIRYGFLLLDKPPKRKILTPEQSHEVKKKNKEIVDRKSTEYYYRMRELRKNAI